MVENFAKLPGLVSLWTSDWYRLLVARIGDDDVSSWPFSVGLLLKIVHFLGSLYLLRGADDLGVGGVSHLELLILYERWAGERLVIESAVPFARRVGRPISVSAVPVGPGIDIGRSCRFLGSLFRFLALLPGGLIRFMPCHIGANHCRLRHLGWERSQETSHPGFLDSLLAVFGYPVGSGGLLLSGDLPLWFCSGNFALRGPSWSLRMVFPMFFTVLGGRDFVLMMRFWVLGLAMIKGDVFHCMSTVFFLGKGLGNVL